MHLETNRIPLCFPITPCRTLSPCQHFKSDNRIIDIQNISFASTYKFSSLNAFLKPCAEQARHHLAKLPSFHMHHFHLNCHYISSVQYWSLECPKITEHNICIMALVHVTPFLLKQFGWCEIFTNTVVKVKGNCPYLYLLVYVSLCMNISMFFFFQQVI